MTSQQLQAIILIAIAANGLLIVMALVTMRSSRSRARERAEVDINATHEAMVAMAEAGTGAFGPPSQVTPARLDTTDSGGQDGTHDGSSNGAAPQPGELGDDLAFELAQGSLGASAELETPMAWRHEVEDEVVRLARYQRPATVVILELDGFERLTERLGEAAGGRLLVATAKTLRAQARSADRCARYGRGRFAILLPETDEIKAINFVERVRAECDRWLEAGEVTLRLAIGWATLDAAEGAAVAIQTAEHRLDAERRHRAGAGTPA